MWRQAKVTVGDQTADQALVNFADKTDENPEWLEWPSALPAGTEVKVGDGMWVAGQSQACARVFHVELLPPPLSEAPPEPEAPPAAPSTKKGTKR